MEADQCPFCLGPMESEDRDGQQWRVCPNGCATEYEVPPAEIRPAGAEPEAALPQARASGVGR